MDPFTGNAAIGYSRLNVPNGQRLMWEDPWTTDTLKERPFIDNVSLEQGIDILRGIWFEEYQAMVMTVRT